MKPIQKHESTLKWQDIFSSSWLGIVHYLSSIIALCLLVLLSLTVLNPSQQKGIEQRKEVIATPKSNISKQPEWLIPEPLPFPPFSPHPNAKRERFKIPEAEFDLAIEKPVNWTLIELAGDTVRFQSNREINESVTFSAGCFGDCENIEGNIAESLSRKVEQDHHRGRDPRVVHWYVHHKTWVEYSLLYRDRDGDAWMVGTSLKWSSEWLNALKCIYKAPVSFPYESEEVLHLAWDIWAIEFIRYCRKYDILSFE